MSVYEIAATLFLIANPFGNSPAIIALIKDFDFEKQKRIMLRESLFAFLLAIFFQYFGKVFLGHLEISLYTLRIAGGVLLLLVALDMIFPTTSQGIKSPLKRDPIFVPIATPLISGPALLTIIMIFANEVPYNTQLSLGILITWIGITPALVFAPYLNRILKQRGLMALAQLMGLFLTMMAVGMVVDGLKEYMKLFG